MIRLLLISSLFFVTTPGCSDEGVTLPSGYNAGRYRRIEIVPNNAVPEATATVRALNGMQGAPQGIVQGDPDLRVKYWGRLQGSNEPDGAHVRMVRLGTGSLCGMSLEGVFPDIAANPDALSSYDFSVLDSRMVSVLGGTDASGKQVKGLNTAKVLWQVGLDLGRPDKCKADSVGNQLGSPFSEATKALWPKVALNTLRHLRDGSDWDPNARGFNVQYVEFMDDPWNRLNYPENTGEPSWTRLHEAYRDFAKGVKSYWPDSDSGPVVHVGGISFRFGRASELEYATEADKHPLLKFIDFCKANNVPLDFVSFKTFTATAYQAYEIAWSLRAYLNKVGLNDTELIATSVTPDTNGSAFANLPALTNVDLDSAYLGAFQTAVRVFFQDVPVRWMIGGRGPRIFADLNRYTGADFASFQGLILDSPYFTPEGKAKPAYMALFPFRQVRGQQRVQVTEGPDQDGMAIMASHDATSDRVLHVIIANANVTSGFAAITYDLNLTQFVPPSIGEIEYKLAVLNRNSHGVPSFHFSETGKLKSSPTDGSVRFIHEMAVPAVHYIQFVKPQ